MSASKKDSDFDIQAPEISDRNILLDELKRYDELDNNLFHRIMAGQRVKFIDDANDDNVRVLAELLAPLVKQRNCAGFTPLVVWVKNGTPGNLQSKLFEHFVRAPDFSFEDHLNLGGQDMLSMLLMSDVSSKKREDFNILLTAKDAEKYHAKAIFHARMTNSIIMAVKSGIDAKVKNENGHSIAENYLLTCRHIYPPALKTMLEHGAYLSLNIQHKGGFVDVFDMLERKITKINGAAADHDVAFIKQQCLVNQVQDVAMAERRPPSFKPRRNRIEI